MITPDLNLWNPILTYHPRKALIIRMADSLTGAPADRFPRGASTPVSYSRIPCLAFQMKCPHLLSEAGPTCHRNSVNPSLQRPASVSSVPTFPRSGSTSKPLETTTYKSEAGCWRSSGPARQRGFVPLYMPYLWLISMIAVIRESDEGYTSKGSMRLSS